MNTIETRKRIGKIKNSGKPFRWMVFFSILAHVIILHLVLPEPPETHADQGDMNKDQIIVSLLPPSPPTPPPEEKRPPTPQPARRRSGPPKPVPQILEPDKIEPPVMEETITFDDPLPDDYDIVDIEPILPEDRIYHLSEVTAPVATFMVEPEYPQVCRRLHVQGIVILQAVIGQDGHPRNIRILRSLNSYCDKSAVRALEQWIYTPGNLNGYPVDVLMSLAVEFKLN